MIEFTVKKYFADNLTVPVYMEFPEKPPDSFVVIQKKGSNRTNLIDTALFVADSYGKTLYDAAKLNSQVVNVFDGLTELENVSASERGSDYVFPDSQNKRYRYQAVCNITYY